MFDSWICKNLSPWHLTVAMVKGSGFQVLSPFSVKMFTPFMRSNGWLNPDETIDETSVYLTSSSTFSVSLLHTCLIFRCIQVTTPTNFERSIWANEKTDLGRRCPAMKNSGDSALRTPRGTATWSFEAEMFEQYHSIPFQFIICFMYNIYIYIIYLYIYIILYSNLKSNLYI